MKTPFIILASLIAIGISNTACEPQTDYSKQINALQARCDSLADALKETNAELLATQNTVNSQSTAITAIQAQLTTIAGQIATLNTQLTSTNGNVTSIQSQIAVIVGQIATLNTQLTATNANVSSIQTQLATVVSQIATLNTQLTATNNNVSALNDQLIASNTKLNNLLLQFNALLVQLGMVIDIDGNVYKTVIIGNQVWMAENLKTTKYSNGDVIGTTSPATLDISGYPPSEYQWEYDVATYGRYYTWYAATDSRKLCPTGWHLPSDSEWKTLEMFLGMTQIQADAIGWRGTNQGTQLKSTSGWLAGGANIGTNTVGFSALPADERTVPGIFGSIGSVACWWTSTEITAVTAWYRYLNNYNAQSNGILRLDNQGKNAGLTIRCLKD